MRFFSTIFFIAPLANAFIFPEMAPQPGLAELMDSQRDQRLSVDLEIGEEGEAPRMAIQGLRFDLKKKDADYEHIKMPGTNGPHPKLSTGIRTLELIKEGHFINNMGTQIVKTLKGCWEVVWKKDAPAGVLLCGFEIPEEYKRNDAKLPAGKIYMSFPVWTKETLDFGRNEKERILNRAKECIEEKNEELTKMQETANPLMKALHYRNAYAAAEKYWLQPLKQMNLVPDENEVVKIQDDLFLTTKGLVWSKALPSGPQRLLGTANLATVIEG